MTLHTPTLSESALQTIQEGVDALARRPEYGDRALGGADPEKLAVAVPHDVYTVGLAELSEGKGLEAAEPVGHRVLIMDDDRPVAAAELPVAGGEGGFAATEGPFTETTALTVREVERWPVVKKGEYDLRVLRLPALYLMALWLKDRDGDSDLLVPLDPAPTGIEAGKGYAVGELLGELQDRARERPEPGEEGSS